MRKLLCKIFIKNYKDTSNIKVRAAYGTLSGIVGVISNVLLGLLKIILGTIVLSSSIISDGVNNVMDALSSIITFIGFKLSTKKADKDHPFGHQRYEYITGFIISILILFVGLSFLKDSAVGVYHLIKGDAEGLNIENRVLILVLLGISILTKFWQSRFYFGMGKAINSDALMANSKDSLNDCITTTAVIISLVIYILTDGKVNIDSVAGLVVAGFIIYTAVELLIETISTLLGSVPSDEEVEKINKFILSYEGVLGVHDLVIHSYGTNMSYVTCHAEVSRDVDVMISHDLMDNIETDARKILKIDLTLHMDPVDNNNPIVQELKIKVLEKVKLVDESLNIHDFRVVFGNSHTNLIFDISIPATFNKDLKELKDQVVNKVKEIDPKYECVIQLDHFYNRMTNGD